MPTAPWDRSTNSRDAARGTHAVVTKHWDEVTCVLCLESDIMPVHDVSSGCDGCQIDGFEILGNRTRRMRI